LESGKKALSIIISRACAFGRGLEGVGRAWIIQAGKLKMTIRELLSEYKTVTEILYFIESEIKPISFWFLIDLGMQHLQSDPELWKAFQASGQEIEMRNFLD
jgi:hypothetical protein